MTKRVLAAEGVTKRNFLPHLAKFREQIADRKGKTVTVLSPAS
jgi:hypothetical protein